MEKVIVALGYLSLLLPQAEGPRKFAPTLPELLKDGFAKVNAGLSQAAVLPDEGPYAPLNENPTRLPAVTRALSKPLEMPAMALEAVGDVNQAGISLSKLVESSGFWWTEKRPDANADPKKPGQGPVPGAVPAAAKHEDLDDDDRLIQAFADFEIEAGNIPDDAFRDEIRKAIGPLPKPMRRPLGDLLAAMQAASKAFSESMHGFDQETRDFLLEKGAAFNHPEKEETPEDQRKVAQLYWDKFRTPALLQSTVALARAMETLIPACALDAKVKTPPVLFERQTPMGLVVVGGLGKNSYEKDAALIVDLGGDDNYRNNAGGGMHVPGRVALVLDCAGNDRYESKKEGVQGSGVLGVGVLVDLAGDDSYLAGNLSQGCGQMGFGLLVDRAGKDKYDGGGVVQGAGQFGIGLLQDDAGDDDFKATICAQGFGGPAGLGLLRDYKGNDKYFAGGKYPDTVRDKSKFLSMSQGFGYGLRHTGQTEQGGLAIVGFVMGGVGLLLEGAGDDVYDGGVFSQGAGYWYALGMLADESGNDTYKAVRYSQGASAHLGAGLLGDFWGNDSYTSWGVSQACAHDFSVAMLLDYLGNDNYKAESMAQGVANARGSFAWLIDRDGTDNYNYLGKDKNCWGAVATGEYEANAKPASFGFFYDLAGKDIYKGSRAMKDAAELVDENFQMGLAVDKP